MIWILSFALAEIGVGVGMGFPTGVAIKGYLSPEIPNKNRYAFQGSLGGSLGKWGNVAATFDFTNQTPSMGDEEENYSTWFHYGGGAQAEYQYPIETPSALFGAGFRIVLGGGIRFVKEKIEIHVDLAPTIIVFQQPTWVMQSQVGIRIF